MPVIACPDCGRDVSPLAPTCPHCGRPSPAGTTPITAIPPPAAEETVWRGSPAATLLIGRLILLIAIVMIVQSLAHVLARSTPDLANSDRILRIGWIITALVVLFEGARILFSFIKLRSTLYTITNQRVMIETGLFTKSLSEIDLRYVDDTQFHQPVIYRLLGIGNVTIISSDKTTPVQILRAVPDPRRIRELIRTNSYQQSQRQIFTRAT